MIAPQGAPSISEAIRWGSEVYHALRAVLLERDLSAGGGDEGGFAPAVSSNRQPLELIVQAIQRAGYTPGKDVATCMDPASSEFYKDGRYHLRTEGRELTSAEMTEYYATLIDEFPVVLLEDGLAEDDWSGWTLLQARLGGKVEIVGDDLFVTNTERLSKGISLGCGNFILRIPPLQTWLLR